MMDYIRAALLCSTILSPSSLLYGENAEDASKTPSSPKTLKLEDLSEKQRQAFEARMARAYFDRAARRQSEQDEMLAKEDGSPDSPSYFANAVLAIDQKSKSLLWNANVSIRRQGEEEAQSGTESELVLKLLKLTKEEFAAFDALASERRKAHVASLKELQSQYAPQDSLEVHQRILKEYAELELAAEREFCHKASEVIDPEQLRTLALRWSKATIDAPIVAEYLRLDDEQRKTISQDYKNISDYETKFRSQEAWKDKPHLEAMKALSQNKEYFKLRFVPFSRLTKEQLPDARPWIGSWGTHRTFQSRLDHLQATIDDKDDGAVFRQSELEVLGDLYRECSEAEAK